MPQNLKQKSLYALLALTLVLAASLFATACSDERNGHQSGEGEEHAGQSRESEHDRSRQAGQEGEQSAAQLAADDTYDHTRNGARLILRYDAEQNEFRGTVENTTDRRLDRVRIEVHLSNGIELGPTTPTDLAPGQSIAVSLPASDEPFETWSAHPEVGREEANHQSDRE